MKAISIFKAIDRWFDERAGWFFTNGRKQEARTKRLKTEIHKRDETTKQQS